MSVFNTRKDRDRHGKPLPHWRIDYPSSEGVKHIHHSQKNGPGGPRCDYSKSPGWWYRLTSTRPRRMADRTNAVRVLRGADPDGIIWRLHNKPQIYFY